MNVKIYASVLKSLLPALLLCVPGVSNAQQPQCLNNGGFIYSQPGSQIYNYNPLIPAGPGNPFLNTISGAGVGLAVSNNINGGSYSPTFYTNIGNNYHYYNGSTWVNTGHTAGAVNLCGSGSFLYGIEGFSGQIWKYDGTGNATLLITITDFQGGGPFDLQGDCLGNFYVLKTSTAGVGQYMRKYSPAGVLLQSWTLTGAPNTTAGGGFGIVGNQIVYHHNNGPNNLVHGTIGPTTVTITQQNPGLNPGPGDFASCELCDLLLADKDTVYYCPYQAPAGVTVNASGVGPFTWTVIQGAATIAPPSGPTVVITPLVPGVTRVQLGSTSNSTKDTVTFIVPTATINAGPDDTIRGCALYRDTIYANLSNTLAGINYNYAWAPAASVISGINTLSPTVQPTGTTSFVVTVSTAANQGSCSWRDTTIRWVKDISVDANYSYIQHWGCDEDTLLLNNLSINLDSAGLNKTMYYVWEFGDNTGDTAKNPVHIYAAQNTYNVKLSATNGVCKDSLIKIVDFNHPLDAQFTVDDDSLCQNQTVNFTSTSVTTVKNGIDPVYTWDFGDGSPLVSGLAQTASHFYTRSGIYRSRLWVRDFVPCVDTAYKIIVVDSIPYINLVVEKDTVCEGEGVRMFADYLHIGDIGLQWTFGDGTTLLNVNPLSHAYDSSGVYAVNVKASYRQCPDTSTDTTIIVRPYPSLNLGPDTALCVGGAPIRIGDPLSPAGRYRWNTGDTTATILARNYGTYYATISLNGCASTDTIDVRKDCYLDIPNVFTPDGDGQNDYFLPRVLLSRSLTRFRMTVYNRWGQIIFETSSIDGRGWDGRFNDVMQPQGVFVYRIEAAFENGGKESYTGNVTLLR